MIEDWQVLKQHYPAGAGASRRETARVAHKPKRIMWGSRCCEVRPVKCHPCMSGPRGLVVAGEKQTPSPGRSSDATSLLLTLAMVKPPSLGCFRLKPVSASDTAWTNRMPPEWTHK